MYIITGNLELTIVVHCSNNSIDTLMGYTEALLELAVG